MVSDVSESKYLEPSASAKRQESVQYAFLNLFGAVTEEVAARTLSERPLHSPYYYLS